MKNFLLLCALILASAPALAAPKESAFDRVMRTNTLRCGYYVFPPVTLRDPETDEMSGMSVDMMNHITKKAGLKIEWTEEVNFANWVPALQSNRFDTVCTPMWPDIPTARAVMFTDPMFFAGLYPLVRADDARFKDAGLARLNNKDVNWIVQEGNSTESVIREAFANATIKSVPSSMDGPTLMQELVAKKGDAFLGDRNNEIQYNKNNPTRLRLVTKDGPVKVQAFTLVVGQGQRDLHVFLNNAIRDMQYDGTMTRLLDKWEGAPDVFLRPSKPYLE